MNELPLQWVVVAEHESDAKFITDLADRFAQEPAHGLEEWLRDNLDTYRQWRTDGDEGKCWTWTRIKDVARRRGLHIHGYRKQHPGVEEAEILKAIVLISNGGRARLDGLLLHRDTDAKEDRKARWRASAKAYCASSLQAKSRFGLCIALTHPETEAWLLAAVEPVSEAGKEALDKLTKDLGFDPRLRADELNPRRETTPQGIPIKTSTKRVLDELLSNEGISRESCWKDAPFDRLNERGQNTGLVDFLQDIEHDFFTSLRLSAGVSGPQPPTPNSP